MAAPTPPAVKLSSAALMGIVAVVGLTAAGIFAYILFLAPLAGDQRLWWTGFAAIVFAFLAFLVYAGTEAKVLQKLAGGLFVVGAGSFYGSILTSQDQDLSTKLLWVSVLSVLVVIVLAGVFVMARQAEATRARMARRRLTP